MPEFAALPGQLAAELVAVKVKAHAAETVAVSSQPPVSAIAIHAPLSA